MIKTSKAVSFAYRVLRTAATKMYYLRQDREVDEEFKAKLKLLKSKTVVDDRVYKLHKEMWLGWSFSMYLPRSTVDFYYSLSNIQMPEYMPPNVYFTTINPILNDRRMAWGYAQKGNYSKLLDIDNEPVSLIRNMNNLFYDFKGDIVYEPENYLKEQLARYEKVLVKSALDSWGGKKVLVFEKSKLNKWTCINEGAEMNIASLEKFFEKNYLVQEYVEQHPFYKQFNPSSFNTLRIYVYRSVKDERFHVLHTLLRVGAKNSVVDNVSAGGKFIYVNPDGTFLYGFDTLCRRFDVLPDSSSRSLSGLGPLPGFAEMHSLALKVAEKVPHNRLIAFDINLDKDGRPRLIELNNFRPGVGGQGFGKTMFGNFTYEVIEHCQRHKHKKVDYLRI